MTEDFWNRFLEENARNASRRRGRQRQNPVCSGVFTPGETPEECDRLCQEILLDGRRCFITPLEDWQRRGENIPTAGEYRLLMDSSGDPRCVIRSCGSHIVPLRDIKEEWILLEGLYPDLRSWQQAARDRMLARCAARRVPFSLETLMLADTFKPVYWEES